MAAAKRIGATVKLVQGSRVGITAVAASLPEGRMTSAELQRRVEAGSRVTFPQRFLTRLTGIEERRIARDDEQASTLAVAAARSLLADGDIRAEDIDLLLFASASRDMAEPATAHVVQEQLGTSAHVFDVSNACNSFLNGIDVARAFILAGRAQRVLVVTGETPTRAIRWQIDDVEQVRTGFAGYTFGDAGAAVLVERVRVGGIRHIGTQTFSEHWAIGGISGGGSRHPRAEQHTYFHGNGSELRRVFERVGMAALDRVRHETGFGWSDFDRVLVHQVSVHYLERFLELSGVPSDKVVVTVPELGNIASATLGVQLARVDADLPTGSRVLFVGLGGGVSLMTMVWEKS
jgi:3-oxoacyl-(acyl-carrier-protein) synthase III